ncbi:MAG: hypothetical protein ACI9KE_003858, partial [Polyangiales bacterium]
MENDGEPREADDHNAHHGVARMTELTREAFRAEVSEAEDEKDADRGTEPVPEQKSVGFRSSSARSSA